MIELKLIEPPKATVRFLDMGKGATFLNGSDVWLKTSLPCWAVRLHDGHCATIADYSEFEPCTVKATVERT